MATALLILCCHMKRIFQVFTGRIKRSKNSTQGIDVSWSIQGIVREDLLAFAAFNFTGMFYATDFHLDLTLLQGESTEQHMWLVSEILIFFKILKTKG